MQTSPKTLSLLLLLLAALAFPGCVTSKKIVGDTVPQLKPEEWNAKWIDGYGSVTTTRIKDAKLGIVEVDTPGNNPRRVDIYLRTLGSPRGPTFLVANRKSNDGTWEFGRVSINSSSLLVFEAWEDKFAKLIKQGRLAGTILKGKDGKPTGNCILEEFSDRDIARLNGEGVDILPLFSPDPDTVFVRRHAWPNWHRFLGIPYYDPQKKLAPGETQGGWDR